MKNLSCSLAIASLALLVSCAVTPSGNDGRMMIVSREWIKPSLRDIHATIDLRRIGPNSYSLNYAFSVPVDPVGGVNPTELHFFTFCIASKLAKQAQHSHWSLGSIEKDLKYKSTKSLELFVATFNADESPPSLTMGSKPVFWIVSSSEADRYFEPCSRMIQSQHLWTSSLTK